MINIIFKYIYKKNRIIFIKTFNFKKFNYIIINLMLNKKNSMLYLLLISTILIVKSIKIKNVKILNKTSLKQNEISENLSSLALKKILSHLTIYNETSCLVSSKLILTSICGIEKQEDLKELNLTNNDNENLKNIRNLINNNKVIEIELMPNHHFVIFRKNSKELYLLNSFQNIFSLEEWMNNNLIMKPFLTIEKFFSIFKRLIDQMGSLNDREKAIIDLFLPKIFSKNKKKIKDIKKWFKGYPIFINSVKYADYNFKEEENLNDFKNIFYKADINYYVF